MLMNADGVHWQCHRNMLGENYGQLEAENGSETS